MVTFQEGTEWDWVEQTKDFNYLDDNLFLQLGSE